MFGSYDLLDFEETGRMILPVFNISIHEGWNVNTERYNDNIAILHLEEDVFLSKLIQPICLSDKIDNVDKGVIVGWGGIPRDNSSNYEQTPTKKHVQIIHSNADCYEEEPKMATIGSKNSFCAKVKVGRLCEGDGGSGLVVKKNEVYYLKGVVSALSYDSSAKCSSNIFSSITNVPKYINFINETLNSVESSKFV
jgi:secreted trypsin-like serine protease